MYHFSDIIVVGAWKQITYHAAKAGRHIFDQIQSGLESHQGRCLCGQEKGISEMPTTASSWRPHHGRIGDSACPHRHPPHPHGAAVRTPADSRRPRYHWAKPAVRIQRIPDSDHACGRGPARDRECRAVGTYVVGSGGESIAAVARTAAQHNGNPKPLMRARRNVRGAQPLPMGHHARATG